MAYRLQQYTIGWLCALPIELAAAQALLDETHNDPPFDPLDDTSYTLGRTGNHNIVIGCLSAGQVGTCSAATIATRMRAKFHNLRVGLMVGIGGGVPSTGDVRLGDVVVSQPTTEHGGVIQYDFGKSVPDGFVHTGFLNAPPQSLLQALANLQARHFRGNKKMMEYLALTRIKDCFRRPHHGSDVLFKPTYNHVEGEKTCDKCDKSGIEDRDPRQDDDVVIHYGTIASGNRVIKNARERDRLSFKFGGVFCFEMEAAGLMNSFPCLVIRGICDYADSHKHKNWQPYAAAAAAAYTKELLSVIPVEGVLKPALKAQTSLREAQVYKMLQSVIDSIDLDFFLGFLKVLRQDDDGQPSLLSNYDWILKNIDYSEWSSAKTSSVLWISGSPDCNLRTFSSYTLAQEKAIKGTDLVLHFFWSSTITRSGVIGVHTILNQIVSHLPVDKRISIARCFLHSLLEQAFEVILPRKTVVMEDDSLVEKIQYLLDAPIIHLWVALGEVLISEQAQYQSLSIILDGVDDVDTQTNVFLTGVRLFVKRIRERTSKIKILLTSRPLAEIKNIFDGFSCIEHDEELRACLNSLRFDNTRYGKISPEHEGSFQWIWAHEEYTKWSTPDTSRLLYVQGKPGSGKSTLTKYFSRNLLEKEPAAKSAIVAKFFYSDREGQLQRSHHQMLRAILYEILQQDSNFFYHRFQLEFRNQRHSKAHNNWEYESLKIVLKSLKDYPTTRRIYLVIDAVDESEDDDRRNIIKLLLGLCVDTKCCLKIFLASRPVGQLEVHRTKFHGFIRLQDETRSDIRAFASSILYQVDFTYFFTEATEYIVKNALGVFIWVRLVGEELLWYHEEGYSEEAVFELLKRLPTELEEFYTCMLKRMSRSKENAPDALKMLQFVLLAKRPLSVAELLHALGIRDDFDTPFTSWDDFLQRRIPPPLRITACGGNFLEVRSSHNGVLNTNTPNDQIVQVMHQTVREFFFRIEKYVANSEFKITERDAHIYISVTCIRYLMIVAMNIENNYPDVNLWTLEHFENCARYLNERPLAHYALRYLKHHLDGCCGHPDVMSLNYKFINGLRSSGVVYMFDSWSRSQFSSTPLRNDIQIASGRFRTIIFRVAVEKGFAQATKILLRLGVDYKWEDENKCNLLWHAVIRGHAMVTEVLLMTGIDINQRDPFGRTPLSWAAEAGYDDVVEILLGANNIQVDAEDHQERTPLWWAAEKRHEAIVKLLLKAYADADRKDSFGQSPLSRATRKGHMEMIEILLARSRQD
ncbi:hypothetical protein AA313_de0202529 [Arthrobotrys entomopaga]|nr:hypothetical protein AA313_de0202529 [Arthrobotrys entomopaga]